MAYLINLEGNVEFVLELGKDINFTLNVYEENNW